MQWPLFNLITSINEGFIAQPWTECLRRLLQLFLLSNSTVEWWLKNPVLLSFLDHLGQRERINSEQERQSEIQRRLWKVQIDPEWHWPGNGRIEFISEL